MAIKTVLEKASGTIDQMSQPVVVYDDTNTYLSEEEAIFAAYAAVPNELFGVPFETLPSIERVAPNAVRYIVPYRKVQRTKLPTQNVGEERIEFDFYAEPITRFWAKETARFPSDEAIFSRDVPYQPSISPFSSSTITIQPPRANVRKSGMVPLESVTATWARTVSQLIGAVNSIAIGNYKIGEVMLVSLVGSQVDEERVSLSVGWSWKPNVTGEVHGDVTGIAYRGHDYVWDWMEVYYDVPTQTMGNYPRWTYVHEVWPMADIRQIGILPP